jgi:sugar-specific transcriptional regulator TrmB
MKFEESVIDQLKETLEILESALTDKRDSYPAQIIDENGTHDILETREEFLESMIDVSVTQLSMLLSDVEERKERKGKIKSVK